MAKQTAKTAANDIQTLFDPQNYQDVFKTFAGMNERLATIAIEAGKRSTDIASAAAKESFGNLRALSEVRDEAADYGKAYAEFAQKQAELFSRVAQDLGTVTQKAGTQTSDLASKTGEDFTTKVAANTQNAAKSAQAAATKAA